MPDGIILGHILIPDFVHLYKFIKQCGVTLDYHIRYSMCDNMIELVIQDRYRVHEKYPHCQLVNERHLPA